MAPASLQDQSNFLGDYHGKVNLHVGWYRRRFAVEERSLVRIPVGIRIWVFE